MVKITVISGFLGAGKTTLIKKLLAGSLKNEKVVLLENEYGDVGIDGSFLKDVGIQVSELNAGCICCTMAGDFQTAIDQLIDTYHPDRILIEPTGVGKLSEILSAVETAKQRHEEIVVGGSATVVDAGKCRMYMKNFGEFFNDQVKSASTVIFSRTQLLSADRVEKSRVLIAEQHPEARIITTPWDDMDADLMLEVIENGRPMAFAPLDDDDDDDEDEHEHHHHHDHDHEDGEECCCHHHHDDDDDDDDEHEHHHHHHDHDHEDGEECCCHHHHHDDDDDEDEHEHHHHHHDHDHEDGEECCCHHHHDDEDDDEHEHHHHHHHEDGEECSCGCGHHHHHHHGEHDADEVFQNIGVETAKRFEEADIRAMLDKLSDEEEYGKVLRAKGVLQNAAGTWFQFDYVPGEAEFRPGTADYTGRFCVIGAGLDEKALRELFNA